MKRMLAVLLVALSFAPAIAGPGKITVSPDTISSPAPAPLVCAEKFKAGTYVNVMVPGAAVSFSIHDRGLYCHRPALTVTLDPGIYEIPSQICDLVPGVIIPQNCKSGPTLSFTVN